MHVTGVVTYYDPVQQVLFMEDAAGAIYVQVDPNQHYSLVPGSRVDVRGVSGAGYTPQINSPQIKELSRGPLPQPATVSYEEAARHENDCRFVSMEGKVRTATVQTSVASIYLIQLEVDGHMMEATIARFPNFDPTKLLDATVRVTGNLGGNFNALEQVIGLQILLSDSSRIQVIRPAEVLPSDLPVTPVKKLLYSDRALFGSQRVRTEGVLTLYEPGERMVIQDGDASVMVQTRQSDPFKIGQRIDVTGFPGGINGAPGLGFGQVWQAGQAMELGARAISATDALSGHYGNALVSMEGTVVSESHQTHLDTLTIRSEGQLFSVLMRKSTGASSEIPSIEAGTRVRLTGICIVHVRGFWGAIDGFELHLRSPADITVLARPSWWTVRHFLYVTSALLGIAVVAITWGVWMRRRLTAQERLVRKRMEDEAARMAQLAHVERQRSRILELINSYEPLMTVFAAIHAHAAEMWPEAISYSHILQDRKLLLIASSDPALREELRLKPVDPTYSKEACAIAVCTRGLATVTGARTVWSRPLISSHGEVLGTLTFEAREAGQAIHQEAFDFGCNVAALAMDNRRLYEDALHRSLHDQLTGLANRVLLDQRLEESLVRAQTSGCAVALTFLDLDSFKAVNDTYSHRVGDLYLMEVARRFQSCLRSCDTPGRYGGDEFVGVITNLLAPSEAEVVAHRLLAAMRTPIIVEGITLQGSVSIGMAFFPQTGSTASDLKHQADAAMYEAKRAGGNRVVAFSASITQPD